ncbi:PBP1A family penicillin-binding protein [bacterium]|nr:PBP1A family penicillin-binding protein [bacterium]
MEPVQTQKVTADLLKKIQQRFMKRRQMQKILLWTGAIAFFVGSGLISGVVAYLYYNLPSLTILENNRPSVITTIQSEDGEVIGEFFVERRIILTQSQIPKIVKDAIIATEDNIFYSHPGIDFSGILRAFVKNILAGRIVQGGSTITQQLTKILFLTPEQTFIRKFKEAILALQIEHHYTKDEILTLYLNQIYFGEGAYGIEGAALTYFDKSVADLDLSEVALLCGLPKAPSHYSPFRDLDKAITRRNAVLKRLLDEEDITVEEYERALKQPVALAKTARKQTRAPYFVEEIRKYLDQSYGSTVLYREGLNVMSTLDVKLQEAAEAAVDRGLRQLTLRQGCRTWETLEACTLELERLQELYGGLDQVQPARIKEVTAAELQVELNNQAYFLEREDLSQLKAHRSSIRSLFTRGHYVLVTLPAEEKRNRVSLYVEPEAEAGLLCIEVGTGKIKAMVGGYRYERSKFNRTTQALRQVGSAFKMFVFLTAIDNGYSPSTIMSDEPYTYRDPHTHKEYSPQNHSRTYRGPVTMTTALAESINVVAVKLLEKLGPDTVIDYARQMGVSSPLQPYLSLALGSSEMSLAELTNAYAVLPNAGLWREMKMINFISDRENRLLEQKVGAARDVVSADVAYVLTTMLEASVQRGTCWRARSLKGTVAAKTGTTDDYSDAWFIGYSPEYVTGVWVGFDKKKKLGTDETGSRAAGPIWVEFMRAALAQKADSTFIVPDDVVLLDVEVDSGLLYRNECGKREVAVFVRGTEPTEYCSTW